MKKRRFVLLLCLLLTVLICPSAMAQGATMALIDHPDLVRDSQAISSVAKFYFGQITPDGKASWIVAQVTPGVSSGHGCSLQDYLAPPAGGKDEFNGFTPGPLYTQVYGHLKVTTILTGQIGQTKWKYDWATPATGASTKEDENNGPFIAASAVICRVNEGVDPKTNMASLFDPAVAIPSEWQAFVAPALQFMQAHPDLGLDQPLGHRVLNQKQIISLKYLIVNDNPFVAGAACRLLAQAGALDAATVQSSVSNASGLRQALLTCLIVTDTAQPILINVISSIISGARGAAQLQGIALGAFIVNFQFASLHVQSPLMQQIAAKEQGQITTDATEIPRASMSPNTNASDKYLQAIFASDASLTANRTVK